MKDAKILSVEASPSAAEPKTKNSCEAKVAKIDFRSLVMINYGSCDL